MNQSEGKSGVAAMLSPLEAQVCEVLWRECRDNRHLRVREIHQKLKGKRVALTSVAVILDRLYRKGLVSRETGTGRGGIFYRYFPKATRQEAEYAMLDKAVNKLLTAFGPSAVSYFNERFSIRKA